MRKSSVAVMADHLKSDVSESDAEGLLALVQSTSDSFRGFKEDEIGVLAANMSIMQFDEDETVPREGRRAGDLANLNFARRQPKFSRRQFPNFRASSPSCCHSWGVARRCQRMHDARCTR